MVAKLSIIIIIIIIIISDLFPTWTSADAGQRASEVTWRLDAQQQLL